MSIRFAKRSIAHGGRIELVATDPHSDTAPSVMLSPKARKLVTARRGTRATVTVKPHDAACCRLSRAVQATAVVPRGKALSDAGVQVVVTGAVPPVVVGAANVTASGFPSTELAATFAGQEIASAAGGGGAGGVGADGDPHAPEMPRTIRNW